MQTNSHARGRFDKKIACQRQVITLRGVVI
jgi:hypothetical protein